MRLPTATIFIFGLLSVFAACSSSSSTEPQMLYDGRDTNSTAVILHDYYSGFSEPERFVVQDSSHWASTWATAFAHLTPVPPLPAVDFSHEIVIVAALGSRPSGSYDIAIDSVVMDSGKTEVFVVTTAPGTRCIVTGAFTQPVTMLKVAAIEGPVKIAMIEGSVRFHERAQTQSCE